MGLKTNNNRRNVKEIQIVCLIRPVNFDKIHSSVSIFETSRRKAAITELNKISTFLTHTLLQICKKHRGQYISNYLPNRQPDKQTRCRAIELKERTRLRSVNKQPDTM